MIGGGVKSFVYSVRNIIKDHFQRVERFSLRYFVSSAKKIMFRFWIVKISDYDIIKLIFRSIKKVFQLGHYFLS